MVLPLRFTISYESNEWILNGFDILLFIKSFAIANIYEVNPSRR
ncbi:hypothetical protein MITSMUL_03158 [Mitsuokella multacida DSM 20544]|uniref:Uncharacterized protein n=1 Tax=Mitsuokella multacida DSM 20544 TaxID=500635 RepID=C9KJF9_9FIRM|nr:hypothetical protein MITSMUL_03158 [Mitsuokella multacida DSM 20544]